MTAVEESSTAPTVVVTGAGGGLGRAFAQGFHQAGYRVIAADINLSGAEKTVKLIHNDDGDAFAAQVDVTSEDSVRSLAESANTFAKGRVQTLVNNAAIYAGIQRAPFEELTVDEWDRVMAVNLKGPWLCTRGLSSLLHEGSNVINISSATVFSGSSQWAHYVASKAGVIGLTRVMARELGTRDITVNAIAPGFTLTEASHELIDNATTYGLERSSLKRPCTPEDIVGASIFLADNSSNYISGQTLVVDGGRQFI